MVICITEMAPGRLDRGMSHPVLRQHAIIIMKINGQLFDTLLEKMGGGR